MRKFFFLLLLLTVFLPSYSIDTHWDLEPQIIKTESEIILFIMFVTEAKALCGSLPTRESPLRWLQISWLSAHYERWLPFHSFASGCKNAEGRFWRFILCFTLSGGITCFDKEMEKFCLYVLTGRWNLKRFRIFAGMMAACIWLLRMDCLNRAPSARKKEKKISSIVYWIPNLW